MAITHPTVSPHRSVDASGRAVPMSAEEIRAQAAEIARGLDALDNMGDEEEQSQTLTALMQAIDEKPLSPRRRFPATRLVFFDSGPLGLLTDPRGRPKSDRCRRWAKDLAAVPGMSVGHYNRGADVLIALSVGRRRAPPSG